MPVAFTYLLRRAKLDAYGFLLFVEYQIIFSFYGIVAALDRSYDAKMPHEYTDWVDSAFGWVRVDWTSLVLPAGCKSYSTRSLQSATLPTSHYTYYTYHTHYPYYPYFTYSYLHN